MLSSFTTGLGEAPHGVFTNSTNIYLVPIKWETPKKLEYQTKTEIPAFKDLISKPGKHRYKWWLCVEHAGQRQMPKTVWKDLGNGSRDEVGRLEREPCLWPFQEGAPGTKTGQASGTASTVDSGRVQLPVSNWPTAQYLSDHGSFRNLSCSISLLSSE